MSDPWTAAWEEAEATAPPGVKTYATLEFRHPVFVDVDGPFAIRAVAGSPTDVTLTLELDAPIDGGADVVFKAIPFMASRPEFQEGKAPETNIIVDNVARELVPYLEQAVLTRAKMEASYREYRSDDTTGPCYGPVTFTMRKVTINGTRLQGKASINDLSNRKFPNLVYTLSKFSGLQP